MHMQWLLTLLALAHLTLQATASPLKLRAVPLPPSSSDSDSEQEWDTDIESDNDSGEDDPYDDFATCSVKGLKAWNALQETLFDPKAVDRTDGHGTFLAHYGTEYDGVIKTDPSFAQGFADRGIQHGVDDVWYTFSLDPSTGAPSHEKAYMNVFDTAAGIIVAETNFRDSDEQKRLPWSELMYQTWQVAAASASALAQTDRSRAPGGPISGLRSVIRHKVVSKGTQEVLRAAHQASGFSVGQGDATWRRWTEGETPYFFYAMLGTDNMKGVVWLLKDHAVEVGRKEVVAVWTRWEGGSPDIWIDIVAPS